MEPIIYRIRQVMASFTKSEASIAEAVIEHPELVITSSITDYSKRINASTAGVTRFCKKIGVSGFAELRLELARSSGGKSDPGADGKVFNLNEAEGVGEIVEGVIDSARSGIGILKDIVKKESIEKAVRLIMDSRKILISGLGASRLVALDLHQKLARIGILSHCDTDLDLEKVQLVSFNEKDLIILFSYKGLNAHVKELAAMAKSRGAKVLAVTRMGSSPLANIADIVLRVASSESPLREGATISRIQQMIIVDILYSSLVFYKKNSLDYIVSTWDSINR